MFESGSDAAGQNLKYIIVIAKMHFSLCIIYFKAIVKCEVHKAIIS